MSTATPTAPCAEFLITKEHRRFCEFADSARRYAHWDTLQPWLAHHRHDQDPPAILQHARTVLYTPTTYIAAGGSTRTCTVCAAAWTGQSKTTATPTPNTSPLTSSKRTSNSSSSTRPTASRPPRSSSCATAMTAASRPDLDRDARPGETLARYPQRYSRIGFAHRYKPLSSDELRFVLAHHYRGLDLSLVRRGLHRRRSDRRDRAHHQRQLPSPRPPLRPDPTRPGDQPPAHDHRRSRRRRPRDARHRPPLTRHRRTSSNQDSRPTTAGDHSARTRFVAMIAGSVATESS